MDDHRKALADLYERAGYLPTYRSWAQSLTALFWWYDTAREPGHQILHNGTMTFADTGDRALAITACHVLDQYLEDKASASKFGCQVGSAEAEPERYLVDCDDKLDLAVFEFPRTLVAGFGATVHQSTRWPPAPLHEGDLVE